MLHSQYLPQNEIPVLLSSKLLRSYGCGQVDLASFHPHKKRVTLYEVKNSGNVPQKQWRRLNQAATLIGQLFHCACFCQILGGLSLVKRKGQRLNS